MGFDWAACSRARGSYGASFDQCLQFAESSQRKAWAYHDFAETIEAVEWSEDGWEFRGFDHASDIERQRDIDSVSENQRVQWEPLFSECSVITLWISDGVCFPIIKAQQWIARANDSPALIDYFFLIVTLTRQPFGVLAIIMKEGFVNNWTQKKGRKVKKNEPWGRVGHGSVGRQWHLEVRLKSQQGITDWVRKK